MPGTDRHHCDALDSSGFEGPGAAAGGDRRTDRYLDAAGPVLFQEEAERSHMRVLDTRELVYAQYQNACPVMFGLTNTS